MSTKEEVLTLVAEGKLSPAEAAARLDEIQSGRSGPAITVVDEPLRSLQVHCRMGGVEVIGDSSVKEAVAEGDHVARREGDKLIIEVAAFGDLEDASFRYSRQGGWGAWFPWGFVRQPNYVTVRVRPDIDLDVDVEAGALTVRQTAGSLVGRISAGSCTLDDFHGTFDVRLQAGSFKADALLDHGSSKVACEAGSAKIQLRQGSSVRISSRSTMGSVKLLGTDAKSVGWGASS